MSQYSDFVNDNRDLKTALNLLDKWAAQHCTINHIPGLALGLVHNGELLWGNAYGYANLEKQIPVSLDTRFRIASISKTFTATAIMQLYDAGKLRLDDPLSKYLSWFNLRYADAPEISIYHCLTHTSGLPRDASVPHWTENIFQSWEDVIETTKNRGLSYPPLQDYSYSNLGYTLLGGVIEAVTGMAWGDYIQTHILNPLGMRDTVPTPKGNEANLATGYLFPKEDYQRASVPFIDTNGFSPSASIASSVNDLVKYAKFHLSKGQTPILSGYSLREMHRVHWLSPDWAWGYGLGTRFWRINNWNISGHTGGYKGYITMFSLSREHDFGVIALTNSIDGLPFGVSERAYRLVLPEIIKITAQVIEADPAWEAYVGTYLNDWGDFEVIIRNGQLQMLSLRYIDDAPVVLEPLDDADTFWIRVPGNPGETVRFERNASGDVIRLFNRSEYSYKK